VLWINTYHRQEERWESVTGFEQGRQRKEKHDGKWKSVRGIAQSFRPLSRNRAYAKKLWVKTFHLLLKRTPAVPGFERGARISLDFHVFRFFVSKNGIVFGA
jgi:hypothetical protein